MVVLLFRGMSLLEVVSYDFNVSDKYISAFVVEEDKYTSSCVIAIFKAKFWLYAA